MTIQQAVDALRDAMNGTNDRRAQSTYDDLAYALVRSPNELAKRWLPKTERVIAYVSAGHYSGCANDAKRLWNRNYR